MPEDGPLTGATMGSYRLIAAMRLQTPASSYHGIESGSSRPVVITVLPALDATTAQSFDLRATELVKLRHPGIVSVLAYGVDDGIPYLVTEHPEGVALGAMIGPGGLLPAAPIDILRQVAAALDFAHAAAVVHGDLQPDMVLVDAAGHASVRELGVAPLVLASGRPLPVTPYRAPEQARSGEPSAPADRYSFAALASVLLQKSVSATGTGDDVDRVLMRGLDKEPANRWPSCTALVDAVSAALQPAAAPAARPTNRRGLWIAAGSVVVVAVLALLLAVNRPPSEPAPVAAPPAMTLSRTATEAGATLVVTAQNLPSSQAGTIEMESQRQQLSTFTADPAGAVTVTVMIPKTAGKGDHVVLLCWDQSCPLQETLTIVPAPSPSASPSPSPTPAPTATPSRSPSASPSATPGATAAAAPLHPKASGAASP